jgi:lysophospholipid acyltransferase (LPLAT)-like uncharacterized protein
VTYTLWDGRRIRRDDPWIAGRLFAVAERDLPALMPLAAGREWVTAIAPGRDGDRATGVVERLGASVVRGTVGRDGLAAVEALAHLCTPHRPILLSVDGPLGPAGVAKPGIVSLGARCEREVVPVAAAARWSIRLPRTWSGIYIPLPFSRVAIRAGAPVPTHGSTDRRGRTAAAAEITHRLQRARALALAEVHGR